MPKQFKLGQVNAGRVNRRGKANLSHDCSYTTQFAKVTPSFCKLMLPNSSLRGSINTEVRVMPMPLPPHGVVKLHRYGQFVPIREVWKPFPEFLSGTVYSSASMQYIPNVMPNIPTFSPLPTWKVTSSSATLDLTARTGKRVNGVNVLGLLFGRRGCFWAAYPVSASSDVAGSETYNNVTLKAPKYGSSIQSTWENIMPIKDKEYTKGYQFNSVTSFNDVNDYISTSMVNMLLGFNEIVENNSSLDNVQPNGLSPAGRCVTSGECQKIGLNPLTCDYKFVVKVPVAQKNAQVSTSQSFENIITASSQQFSFSTSADGYDVNNFTNILICVKLTEQGRELKKVLDVLGCSPSPSQVDVPFNLLPLISFYKAWFDIFNPQRNISWRGTFVYRLVDWMQEYNLIPSEWTTFGNVQQKYSTFKEFVNLLSWLFTHCSESYPSVDADYFSASISQFDSSSTTEGSNPNYKNIAFDEGTINAGSVQGSSYIGTPSTASGGGRTGDAPIISFSGNSDKNSLTWNAVRLLRGLTKYINANSVLGQSVSRFISAHFGGIAGEDLTSTFAGSKVIDVKLGDVIQTATTAEAKAGEFAGVGYGAGDFKISYKTKEAGYFFVLDSIIPQANYVQGADYDSMITKQLEFPTPEFDAIGYDSIKRGEIYHTNTSFHTTLSGNDLYGNKVFGYIPRYTGHKVKKSVLTGDFVLPGTRELYAGFTLDNIISSDVETTSADGTTLTITNVKPSDFAAGQDWRFIGKYKYRNNFDRIFYNPTDTTANATGSAFANSGNIPRGDDFLVFNDISISYNMPLLSVGNSFDTIDGADNYVEHS